MLSAENFHFDIPKAVFTLVLERPVTPDRKCSIPTLASPKTLGHRRSGSRGRSLDSRTKKTDQRLSLSCSPPTRKTSQHELPLGLNHDQGGFKTQECRLGVESNIFRGGMASKAVQIVGDCKALGIGLDIELPRLVLAGERSNERSSLLASLTGIPVPIKTGWGASFPIEINIVRDFNRQGTKAKIIPHGVFTDLDHNKLQEFNGKKELTRLMTEVELVELLSEVSIILGMPPPLFSGDLSQDMERGTRPTVSLHCLQIEIRGPFVTPLSIVDIPGLPGASDGKQELGLEMGVQDLLEVYAKDPKNIIIGMIAASQRGNYSTIFQIAERFDPKRKRTLGILTKYDGAPRGEGDASQGTLETATNSKIPIKRRWYVINNRSCSETQEGLFLEHARCRESNALVGIPWQRVISHSDQWSIEIEALSKGLNNIYLGQIRAEFPNLAQEIRDHLVAKKDESQSVKKDSLKAQRSYLSLIANKYQSQSELYFSDESPKVVMNDTKRLNLQLEKCISTLSDDLSLVGTSRAFHSAIDGGDLSSAIAAGSRCAGDLADESNIYTWINERYQDITDDKIPGCIPQSFIIQLFSEQLGPWESIIANFATAVSRAFQNAVSGCLHALHDEDRVHQERREVLVLEALQARMDAFRQECLARSRYHPSQLLHSEIDKRAFNQEVREAQLRRLKSVATWMAAPSRLSNTEKLGEYLNCDQQIVFQVHDILKALYNIAVRDYTSWIKMSFLGLEFIKESMDVCNDELFDTLGDEEVGALFKPDAESEKAALDLITKHEKLLRDLEALMKDPAAACFP